MGTAFKKMEVTSEEKSIQLYLEQFLSFFCQVSSHVEMQPVLLRTDFRFLIILFGRIHFWKLNLLMLACALKT